MIFYKALFPTLGLKVIEYVYYSLAFVASFLLSNILYLVKA